METVYAIAIALGAVLGTIGVIKVLQSRKINPKDLTDGIDIMQGLVSFIRVTATDMGLGNKEEIDRITEIVIDTLSYIETLDDDLSKEEKIGNAVIYAEFLCDKFKLELNPDKYYIIQSLITVGYNVYDSLIK